MVTSFLGILDPLTLRLDYANAGHPAPLVVSSAKPTLALVAAGVPLGVREDLTATTVSIALSSHDALVLFTDGLIELERDAVVGERRLREVLGEWAAGGFAESAASLQAKVIAGRLPRDDVALFVIRFPAVNELDLTIASSARNAQRARSAVRRYVSEGPLDSSRSSGFVLAVCEAVNNAVEHAYLECGGLVRIQLQRDAGGLCATISDEGRWRESQSENRGRGLLLMQKLTDSLELQHDDRGTTVQLRARVLYDVKRSTAGS